MQLRRADEALHESEALIKKARALESAERWAGLSRKTYRQIAGARDALSRLETALQALNKRFHGGRGKVASSAPRMSLRSRAACCI